jgi:hypothetical protein
VNTGAVEQVDAHDARAAKLAIAPHVVERDHRAVGQELRSVLRSGASRDHVLHGAGLSIEQRHRACLAQRHQEITCRGAGKRLGDRSGSQRHRV